MNINKSLKIIFLLMFFSFSLNIISQNQKLRELENKEKEEIIKVNDLFFVEKKRRAAYKSSHKLLKELKTDASKSHLTYLISAYFVMYNVPDSIIYYAKETLRFKKFSSDSILRSRTILVNNNLALAYKTKGHIDKAKKIYYESIKKTESWGDLKHTHHFMSCLADLYLSIGEYDKSLTLYKKTYLNSYDKGKSARSLGVVYGKLKDFKKSNKYYNESLKLDQDIYDVFSVRLGVVDNLEQMGKEKEVIVELNKIIKESRKKECIYPEEQAIMKLAEVYLNKGQFKLAEKLLRPLYDLKKEKGDLIKVAYFFDKFKEIEKKKNNYKSAFNYFELYVKTKDSINKLQKDQEITKFEVKFETLQKEKEIIVLKKDQEIKSNEIEKQTSIRNIILIASGLIIVSILLLLLFYFQKLKTQKLLNKTQKEINYQRIKTLMKEQELELIKASIEGQDNERKRLAKGLHDSIGSSMAAIKIQLERVPSSSKKLEKIKNNLHDTYEQVRELSHNLLPKKIRQNDYAELLKEYLKNINEITDVEISFQVSQEEVINKIDKFLQNEIFAVLQELITNTVKHAEAKKIDINLEIIKENIHLYYEDNGKGFDTKTINNGIGLENIKNRITQLSGTYIIDSHPKRGTLFKMEVLAGIYPIEEVV